MIPRNLEVGIYNHMTLTADAPVLAALSGRVYQAGVGRRVAWRSELRQRAFILRYHRIGEHDGDAWSLAVSAEHFAQLLLLEHLLEWCFEQGLREFALTIGDEPYKDAFCIQSDDLYRLIRTRSAPGWTYYAKSRLAAPPRRSLRAREGTSRQP
jgi:Acetyltransferase (GNAT) domain